MNRRRVIQIWGELGRRVMGGRGTPAPGVFGQSYEVLPLVEQQSGHTLGSEHHHPPSAAPNRPDRHGPLALKGRRMLIPTK